MAWVQHGASRREVRNPCDILVEKSRGKNPLVEYSHDETVVLKCVLKDWNVGWIKLAEGSVQYRAVVNPVS
jgi:hypothetical protein